jgi:cell division protein FtsX
MKELPYKSPAFKSYDYELVQDDNTVMTVRAYDEEDAAKKFTEKLGYTIRKK